MKVRVNIQDWRFQEVEVTSFQLPKISIIKPIMTWTYFAIRNSVRLNILKHIIYIYISESWNSGQSDMRTRYIFNDMSSSGDKEYSNFFCFRKVAPPALTTNLLVRLPGNAPLNTRCSERQSLLTPWCLPLVASLQGRLCLNNTGITLRIFYVKQTWELRFDTYSISALTSIKFRKANRNPASVNFFNRQGICLLVRTTLW